ncbi:MAG: DUF3467 domain-containing protein [Chloroflexi bacterium]|nr:DUF3467 domain-containing protein [Chloroflexota bacterium]MDK1046159.1 DUF3467 domain-containing protein [Anaerolineales bacterium]MCH8337979.1 DUF3467 domain-containing protein [Chloroflexota bacterium]MCH8341033.1 DUF3467 domain-containing protein [Chloroflexota bacterium]MCH8877971.1 DUF3467 domain-containing protein [Chloroflexota bacterium]
MTDQPKAPAGQVQVHVPADLDPIYANFAMVTNSASEIVMDFAQVMPRVPRAKVKARVVMTGLNAKLFLRALNDHIARFESQFGEIKLPEGPHLADRLFKANPPEGSSSE